MKKKVYFILLLLLPLLTLSCSRNKFTIRGTVASAGGKTLYLEHAGLDGPEIVDSVKLDDKGVFSFSRSSADKCPDYWRLRIGSEIVNLSTDSTETITVTATLGSMSYGYEVEGSEECSAIRELVMLQADLQRGVNAVVNDPTLAVRAVEDSLSRVVARYKNRIKNDYIYKAPQRPSSYFALFQTVVIAGGERLIFNPRADDEDVKAFAAVGTSWDTYYPGSLRGENLHNITIESMKNIKILRAEREASIDASKIDVTGIVDLALPDAGGNIRRLSDLKGHVVLLDFCSFAQDGTNRRIMAMRDVYDKYHSRGLEIYQVSVDGSEHFWKTQTAALPWVCVRDEGGISGEAVRRYNVGKLPTYFLLQRDATPFKRDEQVENLDREIEALL